jgi:hypothetical protein
MARQHRLITPQEGAPQPMKTDNTPKWTAQFARYFHMNSSAADCHTTHEIHRHALDQDATALAVCVCMNVCACGKGPDIASL